MLDGIRVMSKNWIGRAILTVTMGFIILSFAVWGIGDMIRGFRSDKVGTVGAVTLTGDQMRQAYQNELTRIQRQFGRAINNEQARQMGIDKSVLNKIVDESALDQKIRSLGLTISDQAIAAALRDDPSFKGANGQFDRARFDAALRDAGFNEATFVREQRAVSPRREVGEAVTGDLAAPQALLAAIQRYRTEARALDVATLPASAAGEIPAPTDQELTAWFEARKAEFRAPAFRKVALLVVTPAGAARPDAVPAADAQRYYEAQKDKFGQPERRRILQIVYPTKEEADAAAAKIAAGGTFEQALADKGVKPEEADLGLKTQREIFDKAVAEAGFKLAAGAVSGAVKGEFGYAILKAAEVQPGAAKSFAEVEPQIRQELALQKAGDAVRDLRDRVEDQRAAGKPLAEAAKSVNLTPRVIDALDAMGRDAKGAQVAGLPESERLLRAIFASDVGVDNDVLTAKDQSVVWFDVLGVTPARDRTLDEVRERVVAGWKEQQVAERLRKKADAMLTKIRGGEAFEAVAKSEGIEVRRVEGVRREGAPEGLSRGVVAQTFNVKVDEAGSAESADGGRTLFVVRSSVVPPFDPKAKEAQALAQTLTQQLTGDLVQQYVSLLRSQANVSLDQPAIDRAMFGAGDN